MIGITKRQLETLEFIKSYLRLKKYPPTISEIARKFGNGNTAAVGHLKSLEKKGFIKREKDRSRAIIVLIEGNNGKQ
jgi:repressor LexA